MAQLGPNHGWLAPQPFTHPPRAPTPLEPRWVIETLAAQSLWAPRAPSVLNWANLLPKIRTAVATQRGLFLIYLLTSIKGMEGTEGAGKWSAARVSGPLRLGRRYRRFRYAPRKRGRKGVFVTPVLLFRPVNLLLDKALECGSAVCKRRELINRADAAPLARAQAGNLFLEEYAKHGLDLFSLEARSVSLLNVVVEDRAFQTASGLVGKCRQLASRQHTQPPSLFAI